MANENFKKALYDALIPEYVAVMHDADDTVHEFSVEFEKKMKKLIRRRNKPYYKLINTFGKRVACIIIAFLIASSVTFLTVEAVRHIIANFFVDIYEDHSDIKPVDDDSSPRIIEDLYGITYDLSDYEVNYEENLIFKHNIAYSKDDITIDFKQYTKDMYNPNLNTEGATISKFEINGIEAMYFLDNNNYHSLIWDNGEYIIDINSNINKETFIEIAESVKKVKEVEKIKDLYEITYDLSGYEIYKGNSDFEYYISYSKDDITINFSQYSKDIYKRDFKHEGRTIQTIDINGNKAYYYYDDSQDYNILIWDNEDYTIEVAGNLNKNKLVEIAKSIEKVE